MSTKGTLVLAVLAGISIGAVGSGAIHAQQTKSPPPAYVIAEVEVTDPAAFQKYADKVAETMAPFEGHYHYVIRTGTAQALEGAPPKRIVVIAFDSAEKALGWYRSPAYQNIIPIRQGASVSRLYLAEGLPLP
jgi:uncharacterized protein (DUF1330 family)